MGKSKYERGIDEGIDAYVTSARPISLSPAELELERHPVTAASEPVPVRAWVRFHEASIRPAAEAIAWTDKAVQIRWTTIQGASLTAWVWASAVERR